MTKQEIEQAAKKFVELQHTLNIIRTPQCYFRSGANFVNDKQKYTAEDMENIATWVFLNHHDLMYNKKLDKFLVEYEMNKEGTV